MDLYKLAKGEWRGQGFGFGMALCPYLKDAGHLLRVDSSESQIRCAHLQLETTEEPAYIGSYQQSRHLDFKDAV